MNGPIVESSASTREPTPYLRHILDAVGRIESYGGAGEAAFRADPMRQDAILRNLEIVGEVVSKLPPELHAEVPRVDWAAAIGLQEWLSNGYPVVDLDIVWRTVSDDVPPMRRAIEDLLARSASSKDGSKDL